MATQPTQPQPGPYDHPAQNDDAPRGATVGQGPGQHLPGGPAGPPVTGGKPSEDDGAPGAAKPPMSGEGATGQPLPAPGEGPAKRDKPGEKDSDKVSAVSRTEKGDQTAGKGKLNIRLEGLDGTLIDHVYKPEDEPTQYPFRIRVGGVIYERNRVDDKGREVYTAAPF